MKQTKPTRRAGRGALVILALFLATSGALRMGSGFGAALAASDQETETAESTEMPAAMECAAPPAALAAALRERDEALHAREAALANRMAALNLSDEVLTKRLAELEAAEAELKAVLAIADGAAEKDLEKLTAVYEAMKSSDAARLFSAMNTEFAAGFLGRMQPASAAAILAGMTPEQAYAVTALIAGRNAMAPKE
jgi:flagellar motility protein MotE (MotC chaperone)